MAHKLVFTGSFIEPNESELCFEIYPDGNLYVYQEQQGHLGLEPSRLETEDIETLIKFLQTLLPKPLN
jgi:hypothetical protein